MEFIVILAFILGVLAFDLTAYFLKEKNKGAKKKTTIYSLLTYSEDDSQAVFFSVDEKGKSKLEKGDFTVLSRDLINRGYLLAKSEIHDFFGWCLLLSHPGAMKEKGAITKITEYERKLMLEKEKAIQEWQREFEATVAEEISTTKQ